MGYRSDVRIVTSKKGYNKLNDFVKLRILNLDLNKDNHYDFNLLNRTYVYKECGDQVYFGWDYLKWYTEYDDVSTIMDGLDYLSQQGYSYSFSRIGEDLSDIDERYEDGSKDLDDNVYIDCVQIVRYFDDDYFKGENENDKRTN